MESYLLYIGKSALASGAFCVLYLALFQHQKQFVFNRIYLPVSLAISFLIPLITFTTVKYIEPVQTFASTSFAYLPEATEIAQPEFVYQWYHYFTGIYLLGIIGFLFHLLLGHFRAISIIRFSRLKELFGAKVNISNKDIHPFSFFNKIVLSEKTLDNPNLKIIVSHEKIHVDEKHTFDILFAEILFLFQWFNPFAWLIKAAMRNNLEYKTDHQIAQTNNAEAYQLAMVGLAHKKGVASFLTALNGSQLKNRIIMMKKKTENKYALLKQLVVLPLLAVLVMGLSTKEIRTEIVQAEKSIEIIVDGKLIPQNHPDLKSIDFTEGIDSEKIIYALNINHVVATSLDLNGDNPTLSIRTTEYTPGSNKEFEENTTKNIVLDGNQLTNEYYYAIDNNIVSKNEFDKQGKVGFENVVFLTGVDAVKKYGEEYHGLIADATSGVSNFKISNTSIKEILIVGKVTDEKGNAIVGATIFVAGKSIKTTTDSKGNYSIKLNSEKETLFFTKNGYDPIKKNVDGVSEISVKLKANENAPKELTTMVLYGDPALSQSKYKYNVQGMVTNEKGEPISGASVIIKGKNIGTITNASGHYEIGLEEENETLVFEQKIFEQKEIEVGSKDEINVELEYNKVGEVLYGDPSSIDENKYKYQVRGKVTDEKGIPVAGVTIVIKNTKQGTITDKQGNFVIQSDSPIESFIVVKEGYVKQEVKVDGNSMVNILLEAESDPKSQKITAEQIKKYGEPIFYKVEEMPKFPGGELALRKYIANSIKYPEIAQENGIQGKVYVTFIIDKNGEVKDPQISKGVDPSLDKEALRVVHTLPRWKPGKQKGKTVNVSYTVPITFELRESKEQKKNKAESNAKSEETVVVGYGTKEDATSKVGFEINEAFRSNGNPLYIVDGKEVDNITDLDPTDIESISVLKDKSATDLYGEKGKNGVICIETKFDENLNDKLIIVDGKEYDGEINDISPNDIESVSVLKDKSATDIYGSKGKNGVILIETKSNDNKKPLYFLDGKRIEVEEAINYQSNRQLIKEIVTLTEAEARLKYGSAAKNGAVEIYLKKNPTTVDEIFSSKSYKEKPLVLVNGERFYDVNQIDPVYIKSMNVLKDVAAIKQYGDLGKNGVIEVTLKEPDELTQNEIPVVLNGKTTGKKLNEIDRKLIEKIKKIEHEEATKKYGDYGKFGVLEVTSRKLYTEKVDVKSTAELEEEKITTELQLRKFIAEKIIYPKKAIDTNTEGIVSFLFRVDKNGNIFDIMKPGKKEIDMESVVVTGYKTKIPGRDIKNSDRTFITEEVKRIVENIPQLHIDEYYGKTVEISVKFILQ